MHSRRKKGCTDSQIISKALVENIEDLEDEHGQIALGTVIIYDFILSIKERQEEKNMLINNNCVLFQLLNNIKVASVEGNLVTISSPKLKIGNDSLIYLSTLYYKGKSIADIRNFKPYEEKIP